MKLTFNYQFSDILRKVLLTIIVCVFAGFTAQSQTVTGTVTSTNGEILLGAFVVQKGTQNGIPTDFDGKFKLTLIENQSKILVISYLGFKTKEIEVGLSKTINVTLIEETENHTQGICI